jgi:hypothetical protein
MTLRFPLPLARACLAAATLAACGQAFSTGAGVDAGPSDSAGNDAVALDGSHPDGGGPADAPSDTSHADAPGAPDAPSPPDASSDGVTGHDAISVDAIVGDAVTVDGPWTTKRIFVSSESYTGNLGGLTGADSLCQQLATTAKLGGTYKAWLSSTTTSASARLTHATVPYVLVNGVVVAQDWTGLTSGTLLSPIDVNEGGGPAPMELLMCGQSNASVVWTATSTSGMLGTTQGATCADWTSSTTTTGAVLGFADRTDNGWTAACSAGSGSTICSGNAALYCLEQ